MADIIYYLGLISIAVTVYSSMRMLWFVEERKSGRRRIYSFNPGFIFEYNEITKSETGKYGIWAKISFISFAIGMISILLLFIIT